MTRWRRALPLLALVPAAWACAAKQRLSLECVPREVTVYVDGRALDETPEAIDLRQDQPHTVFFKGGGYKPQMVVLESEEVEGGHALTPVDLCTQTTFEEMDPEVHMEVDPESGGER